MNLRAILWALSLATTRLNAAALCSPPKAAVEMLKAEFTYDSGFRTNKPTRERFSVLSMGDRVFFQKKILPPTYDPDFRPVYAYRSGTNMETLNCPARETWVNCVADSVLNLGKDDGEVLYGNEPPRYTSPAPKEPTCEYTLDVPAWKPSPEDTWKRKLASEILREIQGFGNSEVKAIYIPDFNAHDPEIEAYIIEPDGLAHFEGCKFNASKSPHCEWHGFGQSPVTSLNARSWPLHTSFTRLRWGSVVIEIIHSRSLTEKSHRGDETPSPAFVRHFSG